MSSSGGDVDKVLIEENIKGYVRHWEMESGHSVWIRPSCLLVVSKDLREELKGRQEGCDVKGVGSYS